VNAEALTHWGLLLKVNKKKANSKDVSTPNNVGKGVRLLVMPAGYRKSYLIVVVM
jgi:hypothetical protein